MDGALENLEKFQPTRPLRGATVPFGYIAVTHFISTHAPLAGRDMGRNAYGFEIDRFQPTRPLRGATILGDLEIAIGVISTHAPLAGRDVCF